MNKDKYDINLGKWGSPSIYEVENKWTKNDTKVTKINIEQTIWSNWIVIGLYNIPKLNQDQSFMKIRESNITTSINEKIDKVQVININIQDKIFTPSYPIFLPNKPQIIKLNKGKNKINKYINTN